MDTKIAILLVIAAAIIIAPLVLYSGLTEEEGFFTGSDGQGPEYLEEQGYEPWIEPIWSPPSGEIEVLFFSLQAAIGSLIIGYFIGYYKGLARRREDEIDEEVSQAKGK
jgi:cobalt/nickel transport protein